MNGITKLPLRIIISFLFLLCSSSLLAQEGNEQTSQQPQLADTRSTQSEVSESKGLFAFVNVNVIPMDREIVLPGQTVIVRDGKIVSISANSEPKVPIDATIIDGKDKYLMPGLADMHVHLARGDEADPIELVVFLAAGVTTVRNMWGEPQHLEWRRQIEAGTLLGPTIYTTGPITDGDPPYWKGSAIVRTPEEAAAEVVAQKRAGYDAIKVFTNLLPESYYAILDAAKENDLPVYGHVPVRLGFENVVGRGQKSFEHMVDFMYALLPGDSPVYARLIEMWTGSSKPNWQAWMLDPRQQADRLKIPDLAAKTAAAGVWICPTLVVLRHQAVDADDYKLIQADAKLRYVSPSKRQGWDMRAQFLTTDTLNNPKIMMRGFETALLAVRALHDAGVRLVAGTDTPNPFLIPGFSIHEELKCLVDAGLTPYEAIRAATHDAADFVGALDEWGTLAKGQRADLILVTDNPLEDVSNISKQIGVMVRGRWFTKQDLDPMLNKVAKKYGESESESPGPDHGED
jgi:imidazolonepropionase-like amidohydrolase